MSTKPPCPLQPLDDRIVVTEIKPEKVSAGGIHIPDNAVNEHRTKQGIVIAVGEGAYSDRPDVQGRFRRQPHDVCIGDTIVFGQYAGHELDIKAETYRILSAGDVLAIVVPK